MYVVNTLIHLFDNQIKIGYSVNRSVVNDFLTREFVVTIRVKTLASYTIVCVVITPAITVHIIVVHPLPRCLIIVFSANSVLVEFLYYEDSRDDTVAAVSAVSSVCDGINTRIIHIKDRIGQFKRLPVSTNSKAYV